MISRGSSFRRLLRFLRPYRGVFALGLVFTVLAAAFDAFSLLLLIPFLRSLFDMGPLLPDGGRNAAERLIEGVAGEWLGAAEGLDALRAVCVIVLIAIVLKNLFLYLGKLTTIRVQERVERDMRDRAYGHLTLAPLGYFERTKTGELITRVLSDTREAKPVISYRLAEAVRHLATVVAYVGVLLVLSWRLTLIAFALLPFLVFVLRPLLGRLRRRYRRAYDQQGELVSQLQETLSGMRLVKAYRAEAFERSRFHRLSDRYARGIIRTASTAHLASPLSEVLASLVALVLLWVGAGMVLGQGVLGPEQFLAFVTIALRAISPVKALSQFPALAQGAIAAGERFLELLDGPTEEGAHADAGIRSDAGSPGPATRAGFRDAIRYEDVHFAYEPGHPVLTGIDLTIRQGEVVALVGPSGGGKSTLVDLLPRFVEPSRGRVTLDGRDLRSFDLPELRGWLGVVSQDTLVFHDTVAANVAYGQPDRWTSTEIEAAARTAHAHEFISRLPDGYETVLGDRGVRLSGGQRQRIGIARAILRDPPILILDEATSALDAESERLIQDALGHLLEGRTVLMIAHRLSTVRGAHRIVVIEDGRITQQGPHDSLIDAEGAYRRLFARQLDPAPFG